MNDTSVWPRSRYSSSSSSTIGLEQLHLHLGMAGPEPAEHHGQHGRRHALKRADRESPGLSGSEPVEIVGERLDPRQQVATSAQQLGAERRQLDRSGSAGPVEHLLADGALQRSDLLADGRLGVAQPFGSPRERALAGHRIECQEVSEIEVTPRRHEHQHI